MLAGLKSEPGRREKSNNFSQIHALKITILHAIFGAMPYELSRQPDRE